MFSLGKKRLLKAKYTWYKEKYFTKPYLFP